MTMQAHLQHLCEQVQVVSLRVGAFIREEQKKFDRHSIERKGLNNLVTHVDKQAEQQFVEALQHIFPEAGFITEEDHTRTRNAEWNWVIDPLDGTTNFIHGVPFYATSVALIHNDVPVLGVVYEISSDECYYAWAGGGAWMNGARITCAPADGLADALVGTGFPYTDFGLLELYLALFADLLKSSRGLRRPGSAATDMAYVASGRFDAFYEYGLSAWDVAAGVILIREAGGVVTDFNGQENFLFGQQLVCGSKQVHAELLKKIQTYFPSFQLR